MTVSNSTRGWETAMLIVKCGMAWIGTASLLGVASWLTGSRRNARRPMSDQFTGTHPIASFPLVIVYDADGTRRIFCENEQAAVTWVWLLTAVDGVETMSVYDRRTELERWAS